MSKFGPLKQLVPGFESYKENYPLAWDIDNEAYLKFVAVFQKFIDQSISTNLYYDVSKYENNKVPVRDLIRHESLAYKYGIKTLYYLNSNDNSGEASQEAAQKKGDEKRVAKENTTVQVQKFSFDDGAIQLGACEGGACSV